MSAVDRGEYKDWRGRVFHRDGSCTLLTDGIMFFMPWLLSIAAIIVPC